MIANPRDIDGLNDIAIADPSKFDESSYQEIYFTANRFFRTFW